MSRISADVTVDIPGSTLGSNVPHFVTAVTSGRLPLLHTISCNMTWFMTCKTGSFNHQYFRLLLSDVWNMLRELNHYISEVDEKERKGILYVAIKFANFLLEIPFTTDSTNFVQWYALQPTGGP